MDDFGWWQDDVGSDFVANVDAWYDTLIANAVADVVDKGCFFLDFIPELKMSSWTESLD